MSSCRSRYAARAPRAHVGFSCLRPLRTHLGRSGGWGWQIGHQRPINKVKTRGNSLNSSCSLSGHTAIAHRRRRLPGRMEGRDDRTNLSILRIGHVSRRDPQPRASSAKRLRAFFCAAPRFSLFRSSPFPASAAAAMSLRRGQHDAATAEAVSDARARYADPSSNWRSLSESTNFEWKFLTPLVWAPAFPFLRRALCAAVRLWWRHPGRQHARLLNCSG